MVKRYGQDWEYEPSSIIERDNGPWVAFIDYEQKEIENSELQSRLVAAEAERDRLKADLKEQEDIVLGNWPITCVEGNKHDKQPDGCLYCLLDRLKAENELYRNAIHSMDELINSSHGVYGLHLNGDPAPWDELRKGGRFESWLSDFDVALEEGIAKQALEVRDGT